MKENTIFIDNFHEENYSMDIQSDDSKETKTLIIGFHPIIGEKEIKRQVISEVFKALLLHDKLVITTPDIIRLVHAFGIQDTIAIIKTNRFEFADDKGFTIALEEKSKNMFSLGDVRFANNEGQIRNSIEWLESKLSKFKKNNDSLLNVLLLNIEKYNKLINLELISKQLIKETQYDISNRNVTDYLKLVSESTKDIKRVDVYNLLRLSKLNKTLIYSSILEIDNMAMDGAIKPILGAKISPTLNMAPSVNLFDSLFKEVFQKKGIPDLADLYIEKIITVDDYIEILASFSSRKFRQWIMDKDYNPTALEADIIRLNTKISNKVVKFIRWTIPNAVGLIFPAAGIPSSLADSFIIEKLMKEWHPNFFLDNLLKQQIDKKVELHEREERIVSIKARFPKIERNDPCPCGSKKKFKKCCGK